MAATQLHQLPSELLHAISEFLDWPSLLALRLTNTRFRHIFDQAGLVKHRARCIESLVAAEMEMLKKIEQEFWEAAEESFQGYHSSSYSSSSLDPDLRAHQERYQSTSNILACYHCLRWLPSPTHDASFATKSSFSRGCSTLDFDLGGKNARKRICIPCGIRKKIYPPGSRVKHSAICLECQKLADPVATWQWAWHDPLNSWKMKVYCQSCLATAAVQAITKEQHVHDKRWGRYEQSMREGKLYRISNGRAVRATRGIEDVQHFDQSTVGRLCPVMGVVRLCDCWRSKQILAS